MHIKRQSVQKFWPIPRKGTKYIAVPTHEKTSAVSLITMMRDVLKLVKNKKEIQKLINDKKILINNKIIRETNYPIMLFDSISLPTAKKYYRSILKGKKMGLEEINEKEALTKIYKITNKNQLKKKLTQINLSGGKNILSSEKMNTGDFVILNNQDNKIIKVISLNKGVEVVIIKGKHMGISGKISEIKEEGQNKIAEIITKEKETIKVNVNNLFALK